MSFTYISGRGGEGAALGGAEGACCEHDGFCEGGLEERNWVFVVMDWKERKDGSGRNRRESCWEIGTDRTMILLFAA